MIKDLIERGNNTNVDSFFMVKSCSKLVNANGGLYFNLTLQDKSGTLDAKKWSVEEGDEQILQVGSIIRAYGILQDYKGHLQLKIQEIDAIDDSQVDLSKYVPTAPTDVSTLEKRLKELISMIKDNEIKTLTQTIIQDNYKDYISYPAAVSVHHAFVHGLLFHSISICEMALETCKHYPYLNQDLLIAGSLLHDIGKLEELSDAKLPEYTSEGNLIGHITLGAMKVESYARKLNISDETRNVLVHMILAHHGDLEFGSPKTPHTIEAFVLHALDELDAKLELIYESTKDIKPGEVSAKVQWLDNTQFYKFKGCK